MSYLNYYFHIVHKIYYTCEIKITIVYKYNINVLVIIKHLYIILLINCVLLSFCNY